MVTNVSPRGAFASMRGDMQQVPLRSRVIVNGSVITGSEKVEGAPKPVRRLNLSTSIEGI